MPVMERFALRKQYQKGSLRGRPAGENRRRTPITWAIRTYGRSDLAREVLHTAGPLVWRNSPVLATQSRLGGNEIKTRSLRNIITPTVTGWKISRTGASRASSGGASRISGLAPRPQGGLRSGPQRKTRHWRKTRAKKRRRLADAYAELRQDEDGALHPGSRCGLWPTSRYSTASANPNNKYI